MGADCVRVGGDRGLGNRGHAARLCRQQKGGEEAAAIERAVGSQGGLGGQDGHMRRVKKREVAQGLRAAARTPDHGKLEPWRFVVIEQGAMARLADVAEARGAALALDPEQIAKGRAQFDQGILAVAVIEVQKPSPKIPALEQTYSAGAVCLALLNAALAG